MNLLHRDNGEAVAGLILQPLPYPLKIHEGSEFLRIQLR